MDAVSLIVSLVSGLVGGNIAGAAAKEKSLGVLGNSLTGLIGGGATGFILQALDIISKTGVEGLATPEMASHLTTILGNVGGSGIGGAVLTLIVGWLKNSMKK